MRLRFPLSDVKITLTTEKKEVKDALCDDGYYRVNQREFSMEVKDVGSFYAANGKVIEIVPCPGVNQATLELYLNGSTYGAILHQRGIMPMHGSSFVFEGRAIMLCGESGAGKSSLTAAFCQQGSQFITDDVSPIIFKDNQPYLLPLSDRIKLWEDSMEQLNINTAQYDRIADWYHKYYYTLEANSEASYALQLIFVIEKHESEAVQFEELAGVNRFTELRNQIYRWEYLNGMPETEAHYLQQLLSISASVPVIKVRRPENIPIDQLRTKLAEFINDRTSNAV